MTVRGVHSSVILVQILLLALSTDVCKAVDCTGTADGTLLKDKVDFLLAGKAGEGADPDATISQSVFTCQVQGTTMGTYQQLSVVVEYTNAGADDPNANRIRQYELNCIVVGGNNLWESVAGSLSDALTVDIATLDTSQSCSACDDTNGDADTHCVACDAACTSGLMRCTGATAADCCAAFEDDGACIADTNCNTPNFVANQNNSFVCTCGLTCKAGQTLNTTDCTCTTTDICLANEPCENGGTCTIGADPATEYTCNCTGTNFKGDTCSVCNRMCDAGYDANTDCTDCVLTNICEADNPCSNGGTCTIGADPATEYTCDCSGTGYTGDTCSDCALSCDRGYEPNSNCDDCVKVDICESENPCQNGGTCSSTDQQQYTCVCLENYTGRNCTGCGLVCLNRSTADQNCTSCVCLPGYTGRNCTECADGYTPSRDDSTTCKDSTKSGSTLPWWGILLIVLLCIIVLIGIIVTIVLICIIK